MENVLLHKTIRIDWQRKNSKLDFALAFLRMLQFNTLVSQILKENLFSGKILNAKGTVLYILSTMVVAQSRACLSARREAVELVNMCGYYS